MKQVEKKVIGHTLEKYIIKMLQLQSSITDIFDAIKDNKIFEIKTCLILHKARSVYQTLGRFGINIEAHNKFKQYAEENKLEPYYLFGVYYLNKDKPKLITVRQAPWEFVNNFIKDGKVFRIPLHIISLLEEKKEV